MNPLQEKDKEQRSDRVILEINHHIAEIMDQRYEYIEMMTMAYLKLTDVDPSEVELVEERMSDGMTKWYFRRKG